MNSFNRVVFSSLFLLLVVTAGFFIGGLFKEDPADSMVSSYSTHPMLHKMLNLTDEQLKKLVPVEKKFMDQKAFYENEIRRASMELGDVMNKEKAYTAEVQVTVEKVHAAMGGLQKATIVHFFDMRAILDEEQARILDNYVADAMHGL